LHSFRLHEPTSVDEAVSLLGRYGEQARLYAGGTELLLAMKVGLLHYDHLVNVKTIPDLDGIEYQPDQGVLKIGARVTHRSLERSSLVQQHFPLLVDMERRVANLRVRNVGTLAGNLCFAEPHSDPGVVLLLYEAQVIASGPQGRRTLAVEDLLVDSYQTALTPEEVLLEVQVPSFPDGMHGAYLKFGYHERPTVGVGVALSVSNGGGDAGSLRDVRVALGSASPVPMRVPEAEERLRGASLRDLSLDDSGRLSSLVREAGGVAARSADLVDDTHGSAEYKAHLVGVLLGRAIATAVKQAGAAA
jgi:carbon-monoxide dehydrogenase medium subunit